MRSSTLILSILVVGCAPSWRLYTRAEPGVAFHYHSFAIASAASAPGGYRRTPVAAELAPLIAQTIGTVLVQKGYRQATADACDLIVSVGVGERRTPLEASQEQDATGSQVGYDDPDGPFNYSERALVLDVFDMKAHRRVWHGAARELISGASRNHEAVERALQLLLERLPGPTTMSTDG